MPSGPRIRSNSEFGLITDNPLTAVATTFNSARLSLFPVVSSAHAVVTLDPRAIHGEPEIVVITVHTAAATVATIVRGQYGTAARSHPVGTEWIHAPLDEDLIEIVTAVTRPTDPYEGQPIYESDTNKFLIYTGTDWAVRDAGGTLGYAPGSTSQAAVGAEVDVTGCTVNVVLLAGRRYRVTGRINTGIASAADTNVFMLIKDGITEVGRVAGMHSAGGKELTLYGSTIVTGTGAKTYKLTAQAVGGTVTVGQNSTLSPQFILVEDIGAS